MNIFGDAVSCCVGCSYFKRDYNSHYQFCKRDDSISISLMDIKERIHDDCPFKKDLDSYLTNNYYYLSEESVNGNIVKYKSSQNSSIEIKVTMGNLVDVIYDGIPHLKQATIHNALHLKFILETVLQIRNTVPQV